MVTTSLIAAVGLICAAALSIAFGFVVPVSSVGGGFFDVLAVRSAVLFVGLLEQVVREERDLCGEDSPLAI
jgi:hypothetical protein